MGMMELWLDFFRDQSLLDGIGGQGGGIVKVQLAHNVGAVFFNRLDADVQQPSNFLILVSLPQQLQHFPLALGDGVPGGFGF